MIPSETLSPILGEAVALCLRQLLRSDGSRADFERYRDQLRGISRVALVNHNGTVGLHADLAAARELSRAEDMLRWSDDQLRDFLAELRREAA